MGWKKELRTEFLYACREVVGTDSPLYKFHEEQFRGRSLDRTAEILIENEAQMMVDMESLHKHIYENRNLYKNVARIMEIEQNPECKNSFQQKMVKAAITDYVNTTKNSGSVDELVELMCSQLPNIKPSMFAPGTIRRSQYTKILNSAKSERDRYGFFGRKLNNFRDWCLRLCGYEPRYGWKYRMQKKIEEGIDINSDFSIARARAHKKVDELHERLLDTVKSGNLDMFIRYIGRIGDNLEHSRTELGNLFKLRNRSILGRKFLSDVVYELKERGVAVGTEPGTTFSSDQLLDACSAFTRDLRDEYEDGLDLTSTVRPNIGMIPSPTIGSVKASVSPNASVLSVRTGAPQYLVLPCHLLHHIYQLLLQMSQVLHLS